MKTLQEIRLEVETNPENSVLTKMVNGEVIQCSVNERLLILDERAQAIFDKQAPPLVVSFRNLAFTLLQMGIYDQVKVAAMSTSAGEIWWNTSQSDVVHRNHPFISSLNQTIGLTDAQIDDMFIAAK